MTPANLTKSIRFLLIRHAVTSHLGERISGRMPGVHLTPAGLSSLQKLEKEIRAIGFREIFSSPLERCRETAEAIAGGKPVLLRDEFLELDFGEWTGLRFEELHRLDEWRRYNRHRSAIRAPGGECAYDVQYRAVRGLFEIQESFGYGVFTIVTHADVIRALLCYVLQMSLDHLLRIHIEPASITEIEFDEYGMRVLRVNWQPSEYEC